MGMGTYGRTFTLVNKAKTGLNAAASGPGAAGPSTSETGMLSYYEICDFVRNKGWTSVFIDEIKSPIAFKGKISKDFAPGVRERYEWGLGDIVITLVSSMVDH